MQVCSLNHHAAGKYLILDDEDIKESKSNVFAIHEELFNKSTYLSV